jgi:hypothetical protein
MWRALTAVSAPRRAGAVDQTPDPRGKLAIWCEGPNPMRDLRRQ